MKQLSYFWVSNKVVLLWRDTSKPLIHMLLSASLCGLATIGYELQAEEFLAEARVVNVEPLTEIVNRRSVTENCKAFKPSDNGLAALLHWDLGTGPCAAYTQEVAIVAYKVSYEWNDHIYTQRMEEPPGSFIAVQIHMEPKP